MTNRAWPFTTSSSVSPFYQRAFHLSLTVLVRYRSLALYLVLEEFYLPDSYCNIKQYYSGSTIPFRPHEQTPDFHRLWFPKENAIRASIYLVLKAKDLPPHPTGRVS